MARERTRKLGWVGVLEYALSHLVTRLVLSVAIILSLVPHAWVHASDTLFLLLFTPEFVARAIVTCRRESEEGTPDPVDGVGWRWPKPLALFLLAVDLVALISFFPWSAAENARWLRLFRLTRTVMLLRYWAPLVQDLWAVLRRGERARQLTLMGTAVIVVAFAGTVFLNHATDTIGEDFDGDGVVGDVHDHVFWVRMWWAVRQISDPGNMLASPHEIATLVISLMLTGFGLFLISFLIGIGTDVVGELMSFSRLRSAGLKRHNVLINITPGTRKLLYEVLHEYKKRVPSGLRVLTPRWFRELRKSGHRKQGFVVVGRGSEPPDFLREPQFAGIFYREHSADDDEAFLHRADVAVARRIMVLADVETREPDDETIRILLTIVERLREVAETDESLRTTLIAEILDESNIGAAQKAIARASGRLDAHLIPTERLLALYISCVARRPGVKPLLMQLLASSGHEIYSYDYRTGGSVPPVHGEPREILEALYWRGLSRPPARRVLPIGVMMAPPDLPAERAAHVLLDPGLHASTQVAGERFTGFVALAPNLGVAEVFADDLAREPHAPLPPVTGPQFSPPQLVPAALRPLKRVLLCGFRPATVNLIEALVTAEPHTEIMVLVADEEARRETLDIFDGHSNLVHTGLLAGVRGTFARAADGDHIECTPGRHGGTASGRIHVATGDWTSSRQLMRLPRGFGTAPEMDLVVMISSERQGSDATTATALMKLEHLQDHVAGRHREASPQTVVAELINPELAQRLAKRYAQMGLENIIVFSLHELRAFFMFQSGVLPDFTRLYGELLSPVGQSFVRLECRGPRAGACTFAQLAAHLRASGQTLVAVELRNEAGERDLFIAQGDPNRDDLIELAELESVWIIATERIQETTARYPVVETTVVGPAPTAGTSPPLPVPV